MNNFVRVSIDGNQIIVNKEWYGLMQRFNPVINLPDLFKIHFVKCENKTLRQKTGHIMLFDEPIKSSVKGFYIIPGFTRYAISKEGFVISRLSGRRIPWRQNAFGYTIVSVYDEDKRRQRNVVLHLLLARTFIPNKDWSKVIINHIDGDKKNNRLTNLEWCSDAENVSHAREVLGADGRRVKVKTRDLKSMLVRYYDSKLDAFKDLGMNYILPFGERGSIVFYNRFEIRLAEYDDWLYHDLSEVRDMNNMNYNEVGPYESLNVVNGEVITAPTIKLLAEKINISTTAIRKNISKGLVSGGHYVRHKSFEPFPDTFKDVTYFPPKKVVGTFDGKEHMFPSLRKAYKTARIDRQKVLDMIDDGSTFKGWTFRWSLSPVEVTQR